MKMFIEIQECYGKTVNSYKEKTTAVLIQSLLGSQSKTFQKFDMDFTLEFQNSTGFSF